MDYYSISQQDSVQIVQVSNIQSEQDRITILADLQTKIENGFNQIVVDLSPLEFMNSVGLNFLISTLTRTRKSGGDIAIANASSQVVKLLEMTKLMPLMNLNNSVEAAVSNFNKN